MKKKWLLFALVGCLLCSCGTVNAQTIMQTSVAKETAETDISDINGQHIKKEYAGNGWNIYIDADVTSSEGEIMSGDISRVSWNVDAVSKVICPDITLKEMKNAEGQSAYVGGESYKDLDYDTIFSIGEPENDLYYENMKLDEYFVINASPVNHTEWTDDNKKFISDMASKVKDIYRQLGLEASFNESLSELITDGSNNYCEIKMNRTLFGCPLTSSDGLTVEDWVHIAPCGINGFLLNEQYDISACTPVSILSFDEIMNKAGDYLTDEMKKIAVGDLKDQTVDHIELAYMIQRTDSKLSLIPVWNFYVTDGDFHYACFSVNAVNGDIAHSMFEYFE